MKETKLKAFGYNCPCGYQVRVYIDCGIPQEQYTCRKCGARVKRMEI